MPSTLASDLFTQNRIVESGSNRYALPQAQLQALRTAAIGPMPRLAGLDAGNPFIWFDSAAHRLAGLYRCAPFAENFTAQIRNIALALDNWVTRSTDACLAAAMQLPLKPYTAARALQTATVLAALRPLVPRDDQQHQTLLCAALSMNVAIWAFQDALGSQSVPLSSGQQRELHLHPLLSSAWLSEMGVDDADWHALVQPQHERPDGTGYPFHLRGNEVEPLAHQLQLVDEVMAKLSPRGARRAMSTDHVLRELFFQCDDPDDARLNAALIKTLGFYPPGMFVRLANRQLAIVVRRSEHISHPYVAWLDRDGSFTERSCLEPGYEVAEVAELRARDDRFTDLARAWGY